MRNPYLFFPLDGQALAFKRGLEMTTTRPRLLLADEQTLFLEALTTMLEREFEVVATVSDGQMLTELAFRLKPDVILLELFMPKLNGTEAGERIKKLMPKTKLIVLTMNHNDILASKALRDWASGYVLKTSHGSELLSAIRSALRGKSYVSPRVAQRITEYLYDPQPARANGDLSARQREVLQVLAEGYSMKEAGVILGVATRTVAFHKYHMMEKFNLRTNSDLVRFAIQEHVVNVVNSARAVC